MSVQHDVFYQLWATYLHIRCWGRSEFQELQADSRAEFESMVRENTLFAFVEDTKLAVVAAGIKPHDRWLTPLCAARIGALTQHDRDQLEEILTEMYPTLVRLGAEGGSVESLVDGSKTKPLAAPAKSSPGRRGRLPTAESKAIRMSVLATASTHPTLLKDPAELARMHGVSESTIRRWIEDEEKRFRASRSAD